MTHIPLSEALRPQSLDEVEGQIDLVGKDGFLTKTITSKKPLSILLWGPPGCGKTTIARLYAHAFKKECFSIHPSEHGTSEIKKVIENCEKSPLIFPKPILMFVDEIHRFNKTQQDFFLPFLENGTLILIGATTENPSFSLNQALLSRLRVLSIQPLKFNDLEKILEKFLKMHPQRGFSEDAKKWLIDSSAGDARHLLNLLENTLLSNHHFLDLEELSHVLQKKLPLYDKQGDQHYHLISALHKSIRGSDPNAALYYLARMMIAGEDPAYVIRRLIRIAIEDIGLSDPKALENALSCKEAFRSLGEKEGELALAKCCIYLALSPKSNSVYTAFEKAKKAALSSSHLAPPFICLNPSSKIEKDLGYGKNYIYDHDLKYKCSGQDYFPKDLKERKYYQPSEIGFEKELSKRLDFFEKFRK